MAAESTEELWPTGFERIMRELFASFKARNRIKKVAGVRVHLTGGENFLAQGFEVTDRGWLRFDGVDEKGIPIARILNIEDFHHLTLYSDPSQCGGRVGEFRITGFKSRK